VRGPVTYDLVSLLRDCYIKWPTIQVDVQRHLKAAGIFARLAHRDGKEGYLDDIPRTLGYIVEIEERQPELSALAGFIQQRVLPKL